MNHGYLAAVAAKVIEECSQMVSHGRTGTAFSGLA
jgi:hypothetical protein